jgi:hypothetical protein
LRRIKETTEEALVEIQISEGQWIASLKQLMTTAASGDTFLLPTKIHLHAFEEVKENFFPDKTFHVKLNF